MKKITLFSDGSALGNPGPGGYGVILRYDDKEREIVGSEVHTTNNRMELLGVIEGLRALSEKCEVDIISDSSYVVKGINEWLANWIKKDFKKVKNPDLWRDYIEVSQGHKINAIWVRGHDGHEENERCDKLARDEAEKIKASL
ncbi:ribonuclease H [Sulfurimonas gotlandica GD1]|uniref:Ribonuclease HI n=1 Tax=Sulfurimonas gotlandica (strain DSM 19862 / JCM 16533 / GD1) TaxID=929558 RepID=B6BGR8_SULGG|nr:ribonuclease HI [Sulfurimonas gotlandica]EDZ62979.1 RNase H [Sulfurimonas gotlandica GD1]EHP29700.1 ribonuclease H [Sulfurimonas gotlandica GD1]